MTNLSLSDISYKDKKFNSLDLFKFIFSFAIIYLHFPFGKSRPLFYEITTSFSRLAVPFFFIVSSYLFFKKIRYQNDIEKASSLKKYIKRNFTLYTIWTILNIPLMIPEYKKQTFFYSIQRLLLVGSYRQFWFLLALIIDIPIIYFFNKKTSPKVTLIIGVLLYSFGCIGFEFYTLLDRFPYIKNIYEIVLKIFINYRNFLFFAFVFVAIGNFLANCEFKISIKLACALSIFFLMTLFLENYLFNKTSLGNLSDMRFSLLPLSILLFYIIAHIELKNKAIYSYLRLMSTFIFCSHCLCGELGKKLNLPPYWVASILSSILSFIYAYIKIKRKKIQGK